MTAPIDSVPVQEINPANTGGKPQFPINHTACRKCFFIDTAAAESFDSAFISKLGAIKLKALSELLPLENVQRFTHGNNLAHPAATDFYDGGTHTYSTALTAKFQDLRDHNVSAFTETLAMVAQSISEQIGTMFYGTISAACDSNGNVVDVKEKGSLLEALEIMLEKIQIAVDAQGNARLPEIHMGSATRKKMQVALSITSPEQHARIEAIIDKKIEEGRARETTRQARFAKYGAAK